MKKINQYLIIFGAGMIEQFGYTLYILAVGKYMKGVSSFLMFSYFLVYLLLMKYVVKENSTFLSMVVYAAAAGVSNYIAMALNLIK